MSSGLQAGLTSHCRNVGFLGQLDGIDDPPKGEALTMNLTSRTPGRVTVVTLAIGLTVSLGVHFFPEKRPPVDRSESVVAARAATEGSLRSANATSMKYLPLQGARAKQPPKGTIHVRKRYIKHYRAKRATWNQVIGGGKRLGKPSGRCAQSWRKSGKDRRLNWRSVKYLCMTGLKGRGYLPQGIAGSGSARRYNIGSTPAALRNIVLTSWYSRAREPGLFAPNRRGQSVTRLIVMDMGKRRYNRIELVRPAGRKKFRNMDSHGSGLAWAGQYIYMSSKSVLFMFNADDILKIRGRYVLPAVARWTVHGHGGLSSMSIDRSASRDQLRGSITPRVAEPISKPSDSRRAGCSHVVMAAATWSSGTIGVSAGAWCAASVH